MAHRSETWKQETKKKEVCTRGRQGGFVCMNARGCMRCLTRDVEGRGAPACEGATGFLPYRVRVRVECWSSLDLFQTHCALFVNTRTRTRTRGG